MGDGGDESQSRPEEQGKRGEEVLVKGVKAMLGKIGGLGIVAERVEWRDYRRREESGEGGRRVVKACVCNHGDERCE